jgi:hypothetical protein
MPFVRGALAIGALLLVEPALAQSIVLTCQFTESEGAHMPRSKMQQSPWILEVGKSFVRQTSMSGGLLRDVDELTIDEIAQSLSLSREAVKGRLHRARGLIREYLTGERHTARLSHGDER